MTEVHQNRGQSTDTEILLLATATEKCLAKKKRSLNSHGYILEVGQITFFNLSVCLIDGSSCSEKKSIKILQCLCYCQGKCTVIVFWPVTTWHKHTEQEISSMNKMLKLKLTKT